MSYPEYPFGTSPYFMSLIFVSNTSFAISYLFVINNNPSKEIRLSLPQSRNHGYPAIIVWRLNDGLFTMKLSDAIVNFSSFIFLSWSIFVSYITSLSLMTSLFITFIPSISSIFSSNEHTKVMSFSSFAPMFMLYTPGT